MSIPFQIEQSKERIIRGDFFPAKSKPEGNLIISHGFKGFKDWGFFPYAAEKLSERLNVLTFNFSKNGVGENLMDFTELEKFAQNTYSNELEDLASVIAHIKSKSLPVSNQPNDHSQTDPTLPLFLLGHSKGGGVSLIHAFDHPQEIAGVISWNGITNVYLPSFPQLEDWRAQGRIYVDNARTNQDMPMDVVIPEDIEANKDRFNILERVKTSTTPIVLIQGTNDGEHLQKGSAKLVQNQPAVKWVKVPGGDHTFKAVHPFQGETQQLAEAIEQTQQFIDETLNSSK